MLYCSCLDSSCGKPSRRPLHRQLTKQSIILQTIYNLFLHPLRDYPGPLTWRATRLTWAIALQRGFLHRDLLELHIKYGLVIRIAPNEVAYIGTQAYRDIYITRPGQAVIERTHIWLRLQPGEPDTIMSANEEIHARYRRAFAGSFTEKAVKDQSPVLEKYVNLMMERFDDLCGHGAGSTIVEIASWFNFATFDISGDLSFGDSFGSTAKGEPHPWVEIACNFGIAVALMISLNFYHPLQRLLAYTMPVKVREKMLYHKQLSTQKVRKRLQRTDDRADFIQSVLRYNKTKDEQNSSFELEHNMSIVVFACSETTSTAMASIIYHLLGAPEVLHRLINEIRSAFISKDDIDATNTSKIEYLAAVMNEGLRLGPAIPYALPRVVPNPGEYIGGKLVPGGTLVSVNQYPVNRSRLHFSDPDIFKPERFLIHKEDDNLAAFQPFPQGRHMCIGDRFALAVTRLILARLLWSFDIAWAEEPKMRDWGEQQTLIFWQKNPLYVRLSRRLKY